jgi:Protein of unknown function (DUF3025)
MHSLLAQIDWRGPWFEPYRELGVAASGEVAQGASLTAALNARRPAGAPEFTAAHEQGTEPYESFVARTSHVPTRDDLHDFFNALVWLRFPALKRAMNLAHAAEIARDGVTRTRGPVRDALTLLDENGLLLSAPDALTLALGRHDWRELFITRRDLWREARITIVGHALLEKLLAPRKAITAHVWLALPGQGDPALPDLDAQWFGPAFSTLPVLGIPGWWPANEDPTFYDDDAVFRPAGSRRSTGSARPCRS